jgi:hypothetical protein
VRRAVERHGRDVVRSCAFLSSAAAGVAWEARQPALFSLYILFRGRLLRVACCWKRAVAERGTAARRPSCYLLRSLCARIRPARLVLPAYFFTGTACFTSAASGLDLFSSPSTSAAWALRGATLGDQAGRTVWRRKAGAFSSQDASSVCVACCILALLSLLNRHIFGLFLYLIWKATTLADLLLYYIL